MITIKYQPEEFGEVGGAHYQILRENKTALARVFVRDYLPVIHLRDHLEQRRRELTAELAALEAADRIVRLLNGNDKACEVK